MTEVYTSIAERLINDLLSAKSKDVYYRVSVPLPISEIDGVLTITHIQLLKIKENNPKPTYYISLKVDYRLSSDFTTQHFNKKIETLNVKTVSGLVEEIFNRLNELKFHKGANCICDEKEYKKQEDEVKMIKLLSSSKNLKLHQGECCVCYDFTSGITKCKHRLCLLCYSKIQATTADNADEDDDIVYHCPLCREEMCDEDYNVN